MISNTIFVILTPKAFGRSNHITSLFAVARANYESNLCDCFASSGYALVLSFVGMTKKNQNDKKESEWQKRIRFFCHSERSEESHNESNWCDSSFLRMTKGESEWQKELQWQKEGLEWQKRGLVTK